MEKKVKLDNSLLTNDPELVNAEWYVPFNKVLGIEKGHVSVRSSTKVYWKCTDCGSIYKMSTIDRLEKKERSKKACPICLGKVQYHSFVV